MTDTSWQDDEDERYNDAMARYIEVARDEYMRGQSVNLIYKANRGEIFMTQDALDILILFGMKCYSQGFLDSLELATKPWMIEDYYDETGEDWREYE